MKSLLLTYRDNVFFFLTLLLQEEVIKKFFLRTFPSIDE